MRSGKARGCNALWFWKVFVGAFALQRLVDMQGIFGATPPHDGVGNSSDDWDVEWFDERIRRWSETSRTTEWEDARAVLMEIVYPDCAKENHTPRSVWERAAVSELLPVDPSLESD